MILSDRLIQGNESLLKLCYHSNPFCFESGVHGPGLSLPPWTDGLTLPSSGYTNIASSVVTCCLSNDWDRPHSESVHEKTSPSDVLSENTSSELTPTFIDLLTGITGPWSTDRGPWSKSEVGFSRWLPPSPLSEVRLDF